VVDYKKATGSSGQMMIRDTGTIVEFWITSGNSTTFAYQMPYGWTVNGVTDNANTFRYEAGMGWRKIQAWTVNTAQTVTFRLFDTGTNGLGGPTTLSAAISRGSAPPKPPPWVIESVTATSVIGDVDGYGSGGLTIDDIQVRYDESSTAASPLYAMEPDNPPNGYFGITGLVKGTTYYFWVRTHNAKGWSPWSDRTSATTDKEPNAPTALYLESTTLSSASLRVVWGLSNGDNIVETQLGYGTSSAAPQIFQSFPTNSKLITVPGLSPGVRYYFWARTRNGVGWSSWSARIDNSGSQLQGGWYFLDDGNGNMIPRRAIAYVKVGGVWKPALPMIKIAGMWKPAG
jgi:hypothetical protein